MSIHSKSSHTSDSLYSPIPLHSSLIPSSTSSIRIQQRTNSPFKPKLIDNFQRYQIHTRNRKQFTSLLPFVQGRTALSQYLMLDHLCRMLDNQEEQFIIQQKRALNLYLDLMEGHGGRQLYQRLRRPVPVIIDQLERQKITPPPEISISSSLSYKESLRPLPIPPPLGSHGNPIVIEDSDDEIVICCRLCGGNNHDCWNCNQMIRLDKHPGLLFDRDFLPQQIPNTFIDSSALRR
jgi:hypothetical protein